LFADLRDHRKRYGRRTAEHQPVKTLAAACDPEVGLHRHYRVRFADEYRNVRRNQQHQPQRLRPYLQAADRGDSESHQRNDGNGADNMRYRDWDMEIQLESQGHDRCFERE